MKVIWAGIEKWKMQFGGGSSMAALLGSLDLDLRSDLQRCREEEGEEAGEWGKRSLLP